MSKILKNNTASAVNIADVGQIVPASGQLTVQPQDYWLYAASSDVITFIGAGTLTVNDGGVDLSINDGAKLIQHIFPNPVRIAGDSDGTVIGNVGDHLKVTGSDSKESFDTTGGITVGLTETSIVIPSGTLKFKLQAVNPRIAKLTVAGASGGTSSESSSFYVYSGNSWEEDLNGDSTLTIYVKSNKANTVVQVMTWT